MSHLPSLGGPRRCLVLAVVVALAVLGAGCPLGGALLLVTPLAFDFGTDTVTDTMGISNAGMGPLVWRIGAIPAWLRVSDVSGSTLNGTTLVTLTVDRTGLPPGTTSGEFEVSSNGGARTVSVTVSVPVPALLAVSPDTVDLGAAINQGAFAVVNPGGDDLNWTITIPPGTTWISGVTPSSGSTPPGQRTPVTVTVNRQGAPAGALSADLLVAGAGLEAAVHVLMNVAGPVPELQVSPIAFDLGAQGAASSFVVCNVGLAALTWNVGTVVYDPAVAPWLTLDPPGPYADLAPDAQQTVAFTASRTGLDFGAFRATVPVNQLQGGNVIGTVFITIDMTIAAPRLVVIPTTLRFGGFSTDKILSIVNAGQGTVRWEIDVAALDPWLTVAPDHGTVAGDPTTIQVHVDRTGLASGGYDDTITFAAFDEHDAPLTDVPEVRVFATVLENPILQVTGAELGGFDSQNRQVYVVRLGESATTGQFSIANIGTGRLTWDIDGTGFPDWLLSITAPVDIPLEPGDPPLPLTVMVSRLGLFSGPYAHTAILRTNDRDVALNVTMQVPEHESITTDPLERVIFGLNDVTTLIGVANSGDLSTQLRFHVETDRSNWLFFSPVTGVSISTIPLSYADVNLAVDRYSLRGIGDTAILSVYAEDATGTRRPEIAPHELQVSVQVNALSFDSPAARIRIPSQVRHTFVMRNIRDEGFVVAPALLDPPDPQVGVRIFENDEFIEHIETSQYVLDGSKLRTNIVILLDYSASMFEAARAILPASPDPLQDIYEMAVAEFLREDDPATPDDDQAFMPRSYRFALMEFHDRSQPARLVQDFTENRGLVLAALNGISIADHGATALLPAVMTAADELTFEDSLLTPFDEADIRAIALLSDGRRTTPPGAISQTVDYLTTRDVVFYPIGWGAAVDNEPLARISAATGGHLYPTQPDLIGLPQTISLVDPAYDPLPQPVPLYPSQVVAFNAAEDARNRVPPGKIQLLRQDLAKFMATSYVTLNEGRSVPIRVDISLDPNPSDDDPRLLAGSLAQHSFNLSNVAGDVRLGQISMRTSGIQAGAATVIIRCDYVPRNITKFQLHIASSLPFDAVELVPPDEGGLLDGWNAPADLGAGIYRLDPGASGVSPLPYGAFGDLIRVRFTPPQGISQFTMGISVDNSIYLDLNDDGAPDVPPPLDPKAFVYAGSLTIDPYGVTAPALPMVALDTTAVNFGSEFVAAFVSIADILPSVFPTAETVDWAILASPAFLTVAETDSGLSFGTLDNGNILDELQLTIDRTIPAGDHYGLVSILTTSPDVDLIGTAIIGVRATVLPPVLNLNMVAFNFGAVANTLDLRITNVGQSTLAWSIAPVGGGPLPGWLAIVPDTGTTTAAASTVTLNVDRTGLAAGPYTQDLAVTSNGGAATIHVTMVVP